MIQLKDEPEIENRLLLAFPDPCLKRLVPHFEYVELKARDVLIRAGSAAENIFFFNRGFASLVKTMRDGRMVEIGAIGPTNAVGLLSLLGIERAAWESVVQGSGTGFRVPRSVMLTEMERTPALADLVKKRAGIFLGELSQTAACNRLHSLEQRCCRWLLIAHDSAGTPTFALTHEFLALMLGVQRSGLSIVAGALQRAGLIRYTRGRVTVVDREGIESNACECYATSRGQLDHLLGKN